MEDYHLVTKSEWESMQDEIAYIGCRLDVQWKRIMALADAVVRDIDDGAKDVAHAAASPSPERGGRKIRPIVSAETSAEGCAVEDGRTPAMDDLVRKVHASPRFSFESVCKAVSEATTGHDAAASGPTLACEHRWLIPMSDGAYCQKCLAQWPAQPAITELPEEIETALYAHESSAYAYGQGRDDLGVVRGDRRRLIAILLRYLNTGA